jgi:hypothetical protein
MSFLFLHHALLVPLIYGCFMLNINDTFAMVVSFINDEWVFLKCKMLQM